MLFSLAPRGSVKLTGRLAFCALLVGLLSVPLSAQDTKRKQGSASKDASKSGAASPADALSVELPVDPVIWPEPRRTELLKNEFREIAAPLVTDRERASVMEMAQGGPRIDRSLIKKYVDYYCSELTRRNNIAMMLGSEGARGNPRALDEAANRLLQPLLEPVSPSNQVFRREYINQLLSHAPTLTQGHLLTRAFYMVVMSRATSSEIIGPLVDLFIEQLRDPQQTYLVKLLSAYGLTNTTRNGRRLLDPITHAQPASKAIVDFLRNAPEAPWPVQTRCLEALGSLRQSTADPLAGQADLAAVAFELLANPQVDPHIRAWAGWAASRMSYPEQVRSLNFDLVAYELGRAAASLGQKVASLPVPDDAPTKNLRLASRWTEALIRILDTFVGDPEIRGSGLNSLGSAGTLVRPIEQRIRALTSATLQFNQSAGRQVKEAQANVAAALRELEAFLAQNPPKSPEFYPGGPTAELPSSAAEGRQSGAR